MSAWTFATSQTGRGRLSARRSGRGVCRTERRLGNRRQTSLLKVAKGRTIVSSVLVRSHGGVGFEPHRVVHRAPELLFAAETAFRRLNRDTPEEKLDLITVADSITDSSSLRRHPLSITIYDPRCGRIRQLRRIEIGGDPPEDRHHTGRTCRRAQRDTTNRTLRSPTGRHVDLGLGPMVTTWPFRMSAVTPTAVNEPSPSLASVATSRGRTWLGEGTDRPTSCSIRLIVGAGAWCLSCSLVTVVL